MKQSTASTSAPAWLDALTAEEALITWTLCTELADAIWERHEDVLLEQLLAEKQSCRCERHPWHQRPCPDCQENENLDFDELD